MSQRFAPRRGKSSPLRRSKRRYALGWTMLHDNGIGFQIGVPPNWFDLSGLALRSQLEYSSKRYRIHACGSLWRLPLRNNESYYAIFIGPSSVLRSTTERLVRSVQCRQRQSLLREGYLQYYRRGLCKCRRIGNGCSTQDILFAALADSFALGEHFNPTAAPHPKLDPAPPRPEGYKDATRRPCTQSRRFRLMSMASARPAPESISPPTGELRAEQVFVQAGAAVYVLKALPRLGLRRDLRK